jgi:predicted nuclease of restriction endonuclease-like RecB superfamily
MSCVNMHVLIVYSHLCEFRTNQKVQDPVTRHFIFEQAQVLHDSLDSLSSDDDCRQTTLLIARFVQLVFY